MSKDVSTDKWQHENRKASGNVVRCKVFYVPFIMYECSKFISGFVNAFHFNLHSTSMWLFSFQTSLLPKSHLKQAWLSGNKVEVRIWNGIVIQVWCRMEMEVWHTTSNFSTISAYTIITGMIHRHPPFCSIDVS